MSLTGRVRGFDAAEKHLPVKSLVSIGVPTYNRASTLSRTIESALSQDYEYLEIVISDNASTDATEVICREFCTADPRVRYIKQSKNRGATENFRRVLLETQGEFFMWLADDDWLDRAYITHCVKELQSQTDYSLVCGADKYYLNEKFVCDGPSVNLLQDDSFSRMRAYYQLVSINGTFYGVMRRSLLNRIEVQDVLGGDWLLVAGMAYLGKIRTLDTVSIHRSAGGTSDDVHRLARNMGEQGLWARYPHLAIARNASVDILRASSIYEGEKRIDRVRLAVAAAASIFVRYGWPQVVEHLQERVKSFRRVLDRHLLWRLRLQRLRGINKHR